MEVEVMTGIYIGIGVFIITSVLTGIFFLIKSSINKCLERLIRRVDHLTSCNFAIFDAFREQGINGDVKKEFEALKKQVIKD